MKAIVREWLTRAQDDLRAADTLLGDPELTHLAAFHAQQAVEKSLKAVIEHYDLGAIRTHSLTRLVEVISPRFRLSADLDMLDRLEAVYIEARYPSELGLVPYGKPTQEDTGAFCAFSREVYEQIRARLAQP